MESMDQPEVVEVVLPDPEPEVWVAWDWNDHNPVIYGIFLDELEARRWAMDQANWMKVAKVCTGDVDVQLRKER